MSASCLASDRYRRGAVMSLVGPGPSCFSGPAARMSSRKLSLLPVAVPCGTTGIHTATSRPAIGIAVCGRSGTADRPYCCTRSVFVMPLFWIIQKPLRGSMVTVTGSDDIPSAGGAFRYFLVGVFCPPSTETCRVPRASIAAIGRPVGAAHQVAGAVRPDLVQPGPQAPPSPSSPDRPPPRAPASGWGVTDGVAMQVSLAAA